MLEHESTVVQYVCGKVMWDVIEGSRARIKSRGENGRSFEITLYCLIQSSKTTVEVWMGW